MASSLRHKIDRIYIVPTRHGLAYLGVFIVMILVAAGTGNNLIYGLAFVLFAIFFLAMIATHRNLKALEVELLDCEDGFANEIAKVRLTLANPARRPRFLIQSRTRKFSVAEKSEVQELASGARIVVEVPLVIGQRGEYPIPQVQVSTIYPLGLFVAWTNLKLEGHLFVFPKREGKRRLQPHDNGEGAGDLRGRWAETQHEDFREHTRYQSGESHHHVDWKAFARRGQMLTKRYEATSPEHFVLEWQSVLNLGREPALSQMSEWLATLQNGDHSFEMRLPGMNSGRGRGRTHARQCLRALARFPGEG